MTFNEKEFTDILKKHLEKHGNTPDKSKMQDYFNSVAYPVYLPELKLENIKKLKDTEVEKIKTLKDDISKVITSANAEEYLKTVKSGGDTEAYLSIRKTSPALSKEYSRISGNIEQLNKDTTFAIDADGNITLDETAGTGERYGVKDVVADLVADTTVYAEEDGSLTMDNSAPARKRVNEALVDLDKSVRERTTVGVSSDGTLTRAEGAKNTISVNDGLVALSGRTDRIDAAVGAIDGRVTRNTQSIEKNSKAIAANTRTLQQHSARLDSQQRQINENHKEMKRAAAQSAALTGLFQPYSVGKFNATAAVGGYSDEQALAVGVGYRFNEQTAAKAGVAFSDGDASWNVGVNFEF
ncbi:yadA-like C-terminal region family protein [Escherichia coli 3-073-06_S1_C2]|nr:yadA-like C-terminal region family protein [Escherichia coli 3-073-06_S1_C2]